MATELYGTEAVLVESIGSIGVSTNTRLYFIGTAPEGELNTPISITSMRDAATKLGLSADDSDHNLSDAIISAFQIAGISEITVILVSHDESAVAADYLGDAALGTGIYAYEQALRDAPSAVNLVCIPRNTMPTVIAGMIGLCKDAEGLKSYLIADMPFADDQINANGYPIPSEIVSDKNVNDMYASLVWGYVKTSGNYIVSGSSVRACLMAKSDANYGVPARVGGNLSVPSSQAIVHGHLDASTGVYSWKKVRMTKSIANELSADGICPFRTRGAQIVTWGDHTSAFSGGTCSDELERFENRMRMQACIANRWCIKYDPIIDRPLTLTMRGDIINEQLDYLNGLVAVGALIGEQSCDFVPTSNPIDNIVMGQFVWDIVTTETNPSKYMKSNIAFSTRGLAAYTA